MKSKPWDYPYMETMNSIADYTKVYGYPPSLKELGGLMNISYVAARKHIQVLVSLGFISTNKNKARSIRFTQKSATMYHLPDSPFVVK